MLAAVPLHFESNLDPEYIDSLPMAEADSYMELNAELMGTPCKWLIRDEVTTEATCKVHDRRSSDCRNYPEDLSRKGEHWCPVGLMYWQKRYKSNQPVPEWIMTVIETL